MSILGDKFTSEGSGRQARWSHVAYFLRKGPLSILASAMPGFVNYAIILYLTYDVSTEAAGRYRQIFSVFSIAAIVTLLETSKVFIRAYTMADRKEMTGLFLIRVYAVVVVSALAGFCFLAASIVGKVDASWLDDGVLMAVMLAFVHSALDVYGPALQARGDFFRFFVYSAMKFASALVVFVALVCAGVSVTDATLAQLALMTAFHFVFFARTVLPLMEFSLSGRFLPPVLLRDGPAREAITLSVANALPNALEHVDKLIIGAVFGLETLGVYTLGFTTGRFIYNTLKPAIYIYYKQFVDKLPSRQLLTILGVAMTIFGAALAAVYWFAVQCFPFMSKFHGSELVTTLIFVAYGVAVVDAVYTQAYAINRNTRSSDLLFANVGAGGASLILFALAAVMPQEFALPAFAAHYGFRHGLTLLLLDWVRRRSEEKDA